MCQMHSNHDLRMAGCVCVWKFGFHPDALGLNLIFVFDFHLFTPFKRIRARNTHTQVHLQFKPCVKLFVYMCDNRTLAPTNTVGIYVCTLPEQATNGIV